MVQVLRNTCGIGFLAFIEAGKVYHFTLLKKGENICMTLQASPPPTTFWDPMARALRNTGTTGFSETQEGHHRQVLC